MKCDTYKSFHDKYLALMKFIEDQNNNIADDNQHILDTTQQVIIDLANPNVTISKAQMNILQPIKNGGAAARALMDMLFENEQYENKNCSTLEKEYPDRISSIKNYCIERFKEDPSKITKSITGKCHKS